MHHGGVTVLGLSPKNPFLSTLPSDDIVLSYVLFIYYVYLCTAEDGYLHLLANVKQTHELP